MTTENKVIISVDDKLKTEYFILSCVATSYTIPKRVGRKLNGYEIQSV